MRAACDEFSRRLREVGREAPTDHREEEARCHGRGPDFLVHDSHLFDGVDDRQIASALTLAAEVAEEEGMQYIVSLNSDDLSKAVQRGFSVEDRITDPRLTDASEEDGLFGFRF